MTYGEILACGVLCGVSIGVGLALTVVGVVMLTAKQKPVKETQDVTSLLYTALLYSVVSKITESEREKEILNNHQREISNDTNGVSESWISYILEDYDCDD